jgi:hypothetical protein
VNDGPEVKVAKLEQRMDALEGRVESHQIYIDETSRPFHQRLERFMTEFESRQDERDKIDRRRARIHFALLSALITLVVGCAIALFTWVLNGRHTVSVVHAEPTTAESRTPNLER